MSTYAHSKGLFLAASLCALVSIGFTSDIAYAQSTEATDNATSSVEVAFVKEADWFTTESIPGGPRVVGDFVIGPGKVELEIAPGESKTVMVSVTNRVGELRKFNIQVEDAKGSSEPSKTVELLGSARGPYTLKDYIEIGGSSLILEHNTRARIPVTISIPADAEPGGRYGSVLINTVAVEGVDRNEGSLAPQSPIIARVGTLFFITITGETEREGMLKDFTTIPNKQFFQSSPITFGILFENTGSIHLAPYGTMSITNMFGEEVGYVELDPWFALPASLRFREVIWDRDMWLFGRYDVTIDINRGYDDIVDTMQLSFWVLPWKTVSFMFGTLFLGLFIIRFFFKTFEFKRKS